MLPLLCAKNPENVHRFLDRLKEKLRPLQKLEMDALLQYKKEEVRLESGDRMQLNQTHL